MFSSDLRKNGLIAAASAGLALVAIGVPLAIAAPPIAAPQYDVQGYLNSTARCTAPDTAVIFGTTDTSRVAICKTANGSYEYRGVRVRDGAKLVVPATQTSGESYMAEGNGATYTVTTSALSVTIGGSTIRTEAWTDFHNPQAPAGSTAASGTPKTTTSGTATSSAKPSTATTSGSAATSGAPTSAAAPAKTTPAPVTSAPPLPPPLPAEVGGSTSSGR